MQNVDDDEVQSTYQEASRLTSMVCLRKASDEDAISREEIECDLMLLLRAKLERNVEIEPALIFANQARYAKGYGRAKKLKTLKIL